MFSMVQSGSVWFSMVQYGSVDILEVLPINNGLTEEKCFQWNYYILNINEK